jgi:drug/metabolite transporter (DMT)-like permease
MGLFSALLAALFIAISNLFMRKSIDSGGTTKGFLTIQMFVAFLVAVFLGPIKTGQYDCNGPIILLGSGSGLVLALMLLVLGKALEEGPPGLTFSILSAATVMPAIVMAIIFGSTFGFYYTIWHGIGSLLVLTGLFWAGKSIEKMQDRSTWILLAATMFSLHVLLLVIYQWRAILLNFPTSYFTSEQIRSQWFMPTLYLSAAIIQLSIYLRSERRKFLPKEWLYGCGAGAGNSLCTFFLIQATELATGFQSAVIFPLFSIGTIIFSNLWGQYLYQEKVNWKACQLCTAGILIGTIDWKALLGF